MLTPATSASSTSDPAAIIENAFSTQVAVPPFLNRLPLAAATTIGLAERGVMTVGACSKAGATARAAAVRWTNWRRFSVWLIVRQPQCQPGVVRFTRLPGPDNLGIQEGLPGGRGGDDTFCPPFAPSESAIGALR